MQFQFGDDGRGNEIVAFANEQPGVAVIVILYPVSSGFEPSFLLAFWESPFIKPPGSFWTTSSDVPTYFAQKATVSL